MVISNVRLRLGMERAAFVAYGSVSLLALIASSAQGQDRSATTQLETITVTGQGTDEMRRSGTIGKPSPAYAGGQIATSTRLGALGNRPVAKTPYSATSYTSKLIRDQQARTIADITINDPSVRSDAPAFSERDSFLIRGFSVTGDNHLFDGLPYLTNPRRVPLEGVERVEVLKGPTVIANGGVGRVGGAINIIPKRADDEPLTRLTTTYMSDTQFWNHIDIGRRFGDAGEWGIRGNASYRFGNTPLDHNEAKVGVLTLGMDYRGDRLRASLDINHNNQKIDAPTSLFNAAKPGITVPEAPKGHINTSNPYEYHNSRSNMIAGRIEYDIHDNTTVYAAGGASRYREDFLTTNYTIDNSNGDALAEFGYNPQQLTGYSGEIGIRTQFDTGNIGHEISLSASKSITENNRGRFHPGRTGFTSYRTNIYNPTFVPESFANTTGLPRSNELIPFADQTTTGFALADTMTFGDGFAELTLGARHQKMRVQGFNVRPNNPTAPVGERNYLYEDSRISPSVAGLVNLTDQFAIYGNYVEALTEGPTAPSRAANAGEIFPAIVNRQTEFGMKYDLGNVLLTAALFEIRQANGITDPTTNVFSASGRQVNRGIELSAAGELYDNIRVLGGITFMDPELSRTQGGLNDGNHVPGVPNMAFSLYGEYDTPWIEDLTLTGRLLHSGSTYYDQSNTQKINDWTRLDLGARYKIQRENSKPIELKFNVENVTNENYWASSARGFLAAGAPRTFMLSASFDF
jgi:iron complex outermembrane receptor protein